MKFKGKCVSIEQDEPFEELPYFRNLGRRCVPSLGQAGVEVERQEDCQ